MAKGFEASIKELEEIVEKLESGEATLSESLKLFEQGIKLSKGCQKLLDDAEKKVTVLLQTDTDEPVEQDFLAEEE
ncbi:MAG: exodeoxyribonuclease VII small subunit [Ruminococcaceae bacterium]|nr:exodeoxyribonuclease VII small subunit [Oscillospiraceae bacterium]